MPGSFCFDMCCGAGGVCNTILYARECGASQNGVVITVAGVGTMTTNNAISGGQVLFSIPSAGTYTVSATIAGIPCSGDLLLLCDGGAPNTGLDIWWIEVQGCVGPLPGAVVSVAGFPDQTTDAAGRVYYCLPFVLNLAGPYAITVTHDRFAVYTDTWDGASCPTVILSAADGYVCLGGLAGCNLPVATSLPLTDSIQGSTTATFDGLLSQWVGTIMASFGGYCGCPAATVPITYYWPADPADVNSGFAISVGKGTPHAANSCATSGWDCPGDGSAGTVMTASYDNTFACDPLAVSGSIASPNDCNHSSFFGTDCGCGTPGGSCVTHLWGNVGSVGTITLTDT